MQKIVWTILTMLLCSLQATAFNEKDVENALIKLVTGNGYNYNKEGNDILFRAQEGGDVYWFAYKSMNNGNGIFLQLHRIGIKMEGKDANFRQAALEASNMVNANFAGVKVYLDSDANRIAFRQDILISSIKELTTANFRLHMSAFSNMIKSFDNETRAILKRNLAKARQDSIAQAIRQKETDDKAARKEDSVIVVEQNNSPITISKAEVCNCDNSGKIISKYGETIKANEAKFIRPRLILQASQKGTYTLRVKISNGKGSTILPKRDAKYTLEHNIAIERTGRNYTVELEPFGSVLGGIWKADTYNIDFYDGDTYIYHDTFTVK